MPQPTSKKNANLGRALIKNRFKSSQSNQSVRMKVNPDGSMVKHTTDFEDASSNMQSITQENDLDAFLATATLAGTDFAAERLNIQVIAKGPAKNPFLLSKEEEEETLLKHETYRDSLTVPRRPVWDGAASAEVQQRREREAFLDWRRGLVQLEEEKGLLMTPYERNIEVWRQLWRVIERSDIIVQIVDARNPLLFRSEDLEIYVKQVHPSKHNILLINKADMLTLSQRLAWSQYFEDHGVKYIFFSAALAKSILAEEEIRAREEAEAEQREADQQNVLKEIQRMGLESKGVHANKTGLFQPFEVQGDGNADGDDDDDNDDDNDDGEDDSDDDDDDEEEEQDVVQEEIEEDEESPIVDDRVPAVTRKLQAAEDDADESDGEVGLEETVAGVQISKAYRKGDCTTTSNLSEKVKILSVQELLDRIKDFYPSATSSESTTTDRKTVIGFVGYPNVGKSSTLNALVGAKKVTVSATPGKTKHFQTIHLDEDTILCDCPGLVFPSFATTKAEMVVNGVLPIDQLREHTGPSMLVAQRIPRHALEIIYGIKLRTLDEEGNIDPTAPVSGEDLCQAYAVARGFKKAGQGNPDESRAARIILKDYVQGKLLFCHPPPGHQVSEFNKETYSGPEFAPRKKKSKHGGKGSGGANNEVALEGMPGFAGVSPAEEALEGRTVDATFFKAKASTGAVKTKGKFGADGFTRPMIYPHQIGAVATAGGVQQAPSKGKGKGKAVEIKVAPPAMGFGLDDPHSKKHKKGRRAKVRTNWTADERAD